MSFGAGVGVCDRTSVEGRRGGRVGAGCGCVSAQEVVVGTCVCKNAGVAVGTFVGASRSGSGLGRAERVVGVSGVFNLKTPPGALGSLLKKKKLHELLKL